MRCSGQSSRPQGQDLFALLSAQDVGHPGAGSSPAPVVNVPARSAPLAGFPVSFDGRPGFRCVRNRPTYVNPQHLFLGTAADNAADMMRKKRNPHGRRPRGIEHAWALVDDDAVRRAREYVAEGVPIGDVAFAFEVSKDAIWEAVTGKTWRHVA
jgi:hypothetical protein